MKCQVEPPLKYRVELPLKHQLSLLKLTNQRLLYSADIGQWEVSTARKCEVYVTFSDCLPVKHFLIGK